jgi:hypothetical protein
MSRSFRPGLCNPRFVRTGDKAHIIRFRGQLGARDNFLCLRIYDVQQSGASVGDVDEAAIGSEEVMP